MATRQYIGARYVIKVYENSLNPTSAEWESSVNYEPLTMVTYNNGSYLSKKEVPASVGNPALNPTYWVQTGFYNGQIASLQNQIDTINSNLANIFINVKDFGAVGDGVTDDTNAIQTALNTGMNVLFPDGTYLISDTLTYDGGKISGTGVIKINSTLEKGILCSNGDTLEVDGLKIDGQNMCAQLLAVQYYEDVHIHDIECKNTNNNNLDSIRSCSGISILYSKNVEVNRCRITNINRTQISAGTISSAGIVSYADCSNIHDNYINHVQCSAQQGDCDGIYVTGREAGTDGLYKGIAIINNNRIFDCTGRFIKSQVRLITVSNNEMRILNDWTTSAMFIAVDLQESNGVITNNIIDFKNTYSRDYTFVSRADINAYNLKHSITINNNRLIGVENSGVRVRGILRIDNSIASEINAVITDNIIEGALYENIVTMEGTTIPHGCIEIKNNIVKALQIVGSVTLNSVVNLMFDIQDNINTNSSEMDFSSTATIFDKLILKNNENTAVLFTAALDFNDLKICDFVHYDATKISNKDYGGTGYIHMIKDAHHWCYYYIQANNPVPMYCGLIT